MTNLSISIFRFLGSREQLRFGSWSLGFLSSFVIRHSDFSPIPTCEREKNGLQFGLNVLARIQCLTDFVAQQPAKTAAQPQHHGLDARLSHAEPLGQCFIVFYCRLTRECRLQRRETFAPPGSNHLLSQS